jgi:DNA-3-methyladenine glycosylase II
MSNTSRPNSNGLSFDPLEAVEYLSKADATLGRLMSVVGPFNIQIRSLSSPFEALARNIIYQQLHGAAAATIHSRVLSVVGGKKRMRPQNILEASDEQLRSAGLSRNKMMALRDLAEKSLDGTVPTGARLRRMGDEEIIERLTRVRGIGQWTVEILLMFGLGRPDVLPVGDYGVRKGFSLVYGTEGLPAPKELARYGERWRPYRSVASWYMWRAVDLPKDILIQAD